MEAMEIYRIGHYYDTNHISYRTLINYIIGELEKNTHFPKWGRQTLEEIFSKTDSEAEFFRELCDIYKKYYYITKI